MLNPDRPPMMLGLFLLIMVTAGASARAQQTQETPMTVLDQRQDRLIVTLPNRLIIAAQRVPAAPVVSVQAWVKTGSIYEQEHVGAGLSHFLEHLVSGGTTENRTEARSNALLGRIGAQTNAATSLDNVWYYINTTSEHTDTAIDLLSDWLQHNLVLESEYARERDVIRSEFKMGDADPGRIFWKLTQRARYDAHPARHPTIGYLDEFLTISRDEIHDFYKRMYVPNNTVFVVAGDIDPRKVVDQVARRWKDAQPRKLPDLVFPKRTVRDQPVTVTGRAAINRTRLRLALPNVMLGEPGDYELDLLATILGGGESSRLVRTLRDDQRLVTSIDAFNWSTTWGPAMFGIDSELAEGVTPDQAKAAILAQLARLREQPVTDAELDRAKRKTLAAVVSANQTAQGVAMRLARDIIGPHDPDYLDKYIERVQTLTADDLMAAADRFFVEDRLTTVILEPKPQGEAVEPLKRVEAVDLPEDAVEPFELDNRRLIAALQDHDKAAAEVTPVQVEPIQTYTLDNGLRLLVQRSTVVPAAAVHLYRLGGLLADEPGREGVAHAAALMQRRGTQTRSAAQIAEAIDDLGARLNTGSGNSTSYARGFALRDDLPTLVQIMADLTLRPSFPEDEWQTMQPRILAAIDRQRESIWGEVRHAFREAYYGDHPWSAPPVGRREVVEQLTAEDLKSFHHAHLSAEETVIAVVGDVDPDQVKALFEQHFAAMPARAEVPFDPPPVPAYEPGLSQQAIDKPGSAVQIGFPGIARDHPDYAPLTVLANVMSDFPGGYLEQELRGRGPGIAYGVHAGLFTGVAPGYFSIVFNARPDVTAEGLARSMSVVQRMRDGRITDADLDRARAKVLTREFTGRQSHSDRAAAAALDALYGVDDPTGRQFLDTVAALDLAALEAIAQQYLGDPLVVVVTQEPIDAIQLEEAIKPEPVPAE